MDLGIAGRRAAVAAASDGLGFATAAARAAEGVEVVICGRDAGRLDAAVARLGPPARGLVADLATVDGATAFAREAEAELGGVDILIANAGGPPPGTFASTDLEAYAPALALNLLSTVALCHALVPGMRERRWGRVVAITSVAVRQPIANLILSNTARAGVTGFLKTLAREVAADGVTVNSLQPGLHATGRLAQLHGGDLSAVAEQIPAGVVGDPADFGRLAAVLCSEAARFVTGTHTPVDGGAYAGLL